MNIFKRCPERPGELESHVFLEQVRGALRLGPELEWQTSSANGWEDSAAMADTRPSLLVMNPND